MSKFSPFGVGEYWDEDKFIASWLRATNAFTDNPVSAFDFPLRYRLKALCDQDGFDLRILCKDGTLINDGLGTQAVTFVENHDIARNDPVINDKMLAYAFILTHEGYPCVFWQDYFNYNLAMAGTPNGIEVLVHLHEKYAGGKTNVLHCESDLYIMERTGSPTQRGLLFILNNSEEWSGKNVRTQWPLKQFIPLAWNGHNTNTAPVNKWSDENGTSDFWAPPRGYAVYIPQ